MTKDAFDAAGEYADDIDIEATDGEEQGAGASWWTLPGGGNGLICTVSYECSFPRRSCGLK